MFTLLLTFEAGGGTAAGFSVDREFLACELAAIPGLTEALAHTPSAADDPFLAKDAAPLLVLQLEFARLSDLEMAAGAGGLLTALLQNEPMHPLAAASATQQALVRRQFEVPSPAAPSASKPLCSYLVAYEGPADDLNAWLGHYLANHIPLMRRLPGIRQLEVLTRLDCVSHLPARRVDFMQRNRVVFDSPAALAAALASPIRAEMRADYHALPRFAGSVLHFPMITHRLDVSSP